VIVITGSAATTAVAGLLQFKTLAAEIGISPAIRHANTTIPDPGSPQTIFVIGSDHRAGEPISSANTDTMMLVRLNPDSSTINVLSIPRDLEVQIPEGGGTVTSKLNAAYSIGGPNLLIKVLQQQVFQGLKVNHIIDINFGGFADLVNAIGCVYTDVDHRYYNNTASTDYSSIDLQPGYQKLCGTDALTFVRFRHTDNDIVRNARQQDFIRWAKDQYSTSQIIANKDKLLTIFGEHTQTDHNLHTVDGLINLFNLVAFSAGHEIKQIKFPALFLPCNTSPTATGGQAPCYVSATAHAESRTFAAFMAPTRAAATSAASKHVRSGSRGSATRGAAVTSDVSDGSAQAAALSRVKMPIYYPRLIASGSNYCSGVVGNCPVQIASPRSYPRAYLIRDQHGKPYRAYRMTLSIDPSNGEYYGVQGTTWQQPPILNSPTETRVVNGKQLLLYANGGKITIVGWRTSGGVYWISNTLTSTLSNSQMIAIAASLTRA
jgi:LCP family protein required for cell wall assembly